eukprot:Awhi_evm1s7063
MIYDDNDDNDADDANDNNDGNDEGVDLDEETKSEMLEYINFSAFSSEEIIFVQERYPDIYNQMWLSPFAKSKILSKSQINRFMQNENDF